MRTGEERFNLSDLARLSRVKRRKPRELPTLGEELLAFFKQNVQKRHTRLEKIAEVWNAYIPSSLLPHTCLESYHAGTLKVLVDSSSHLYELKTVLLAGLEKQILAACRVTGLRRISAKHGRWYDGDAGEKRVRY